MQPASGLGPQGLELCTVMLTVKELKRRHAIETLRGDWRSLRLLRIKRGWKWFEFHYGIIKERALEQISGCAGGNCSN